MTPQDRIFVAKLILKCMYRLLQVLRSEPVAFKYTITLAGDMATLCDCPREDLWS